MSEASLGDSGQPNAIIIGLDSLPGIQAARLLARRGVPVLAIAARRDHYCCRTKVCEQIVFANTQTDDFIAVLETLGPRLADKAVLVPCTDMSVRCLSRWRHRLAEWYHIVLPEPDVVELLMNKARFYAWAQQEGLPIPRTAFLHRRTDAAEAAEQLNFPCVLKPALRTPAWTTQSPSKVYKASTAEALLALYDRCSQWSEVLIAQEWVEGPDSNLYSCNCYFGIDARLIATFVARKLRQWPPQTGVSCLGEECRNDVVLRETVRLFERAGYSGLGYVEMKRDERSGEYFIMEANIGRPTVRSAIAEAGGVELLSAMYCDALGRPLSVNLDQTYQGVKWIHLHYDFRSALYYWRRGDLSLWEWWQSWRGRKTYALFSWSDPAPFWADLRSTLGRGLKKVARATRKATLRDEKPS